MGKRLNMFVMIMLHFFLDDQLEDVRNKMLGLWNVEITCSRQSYPLQIGAIGWDFAHFNWRYKSSTLFFIGDKLSYPPF